MNNTTRWPPLPLDSWRDTYATLHMWTQIVGKVTLALTPRMNHFWNVAMQVTPRGLSTPTLVHGDLVFTMSFDFISHQLIIECSNGNRETISLEPRTVAEFYRLVMESLRRLGVNVRIWPMAVELPNPIRLDNDEIHYAYNPESANAFWRILIGIKPVFEAFRSEFIGKSSPVHFFWGSFDLASTRRMLAFGATACAHSTSSAISNAQPESMRVFPCGVAFVKLKQFDAVAPTLPQTSGRPNVVLNLFTSSTIVGWS